MDKRIIALESASGSYRDSYHKKTKAEFTDEDAITPESNREV